MENDLGKILIDLNNYFLYFELLKILWGFN